jgi:hypothetical protein
MRRTKKLWAFAGVVGLGLGATGAYVIVRAGLDSSHGVADLRAESIGLSILLRNESDSLE